MRNDVLSLRFAVKAALLAGASTMFMLSGAPALAQDASTSDKDSNIIIVTAQKRAERLEEVPMSVSVVTGETLVNSGVTSLRDLSNVTSGFLLGSAGSTAQPALRGITTAINGNFEGNIATYVDGVYQPAPISLNIDLPNIESVQVLKGPQGTFYGRNAAGGAILLTTATPSDTWTGKAEFTYASFNDRRGSAYISGPLVENVAVGVAGYMRRSDSYVKLASRTTPGEASCCALPTEQDMLRVKLKADLSESFRATLAYNYVRVDDPHLLVYSPIENVNPGGFFVYTRPGGATLPTGLGVVATDLDSVAQSKQHESALTLELDTGAGTIKSISSYSQLKSDVRFDFDGSYIPANYGIFPFTEKTFQQAIDFTTSATDKIDLSIGGMYFHDRLIFDPRRNANYAGLNPLNPGTTPGTIADYIAISSIDVKQTKNAFAIYADANYHLTDKLYINAGGRYSHEKHDIFTETTGIAGLVRAPINTGDTFSKFTPHASIRYEISPRTNVYFTYSKGFRSGVFNTTPPSCVNATPVATDCYLPARQESIDSFEVGFKTAGNHYRFDIAGFYYNYKDLQISATRATSAGTPVVDFVNAPKANIYGIDASFELKPVENFTIRGSVLYLHARYGDGFIFSGLGVNPAAAGLNVNTDPLKTLVNVGQNQDLSGLPMSRSPEFSGNLGMDYHIPRGDGGLRFSANLKYTSSYVLRNPSIWCQATPVELAGVTSTYNCAGIPAGRLREQRFVENGYALVNASITWTDPSDHYYVRIWGTNLTNHIYAQDANGSVAGTYSAQAEPRVFGGTIGIKF